MSQNYAEAATVYEAINKVLGRPIKPSILNADETRSSEAIEWAFAHYVLAHKGKLGAFDFVRSVSIGRTLFVGEGDLSFSLALAKLAPGAARNFVSTTFETVRRLSPTGVGNADWLSKAGAKVLHGVDATQLDTHFGSVKFNSIIFNFPNIAKRMPVYGHNPNHNLARKFLRSAARQLLPGGQIIITLVDSPFYAGAFNLPEAARYAGLAEPNIYSFRPGQFPGYTHTNTLGGQSALARHRSFCTWVFRRA